MEKVLKINLKKKSSYHIQFMKFINFCFYKKVISKNIDRKLYLYKVYIDTVLKYDIWDLKG